MSLGPADAGTAAPSPDNPTLLARLTGVIARPGRTFQVVIARPRWVALMATLTLVSFVPSAIVLATDVGQQALVDQWERTSVAFGWAVDDAEYATMQDVSRRYSIAYAAAAAVARGPVVACVIAAAVYAIGTASRPRVRFSQVLAVVVHAGAILALRDVVAAPLNYVRESVASPVTALALTGIVDEASPVARLLSMIDLFIVWWVAVLAIGFAALYGRRARTVGLWLFGAYIGLAALLAVAMAVLSTNS